MASGNSRGGLKMIGAVLGGLLALVSTTVAVLQLFYGDGWWKPPESRPDPVTPPGPVPAGEPVAGDSPSAAARTALGPDSASEVREPGPEPLEQDRGTSGLDRPVPAAEPTAAPPIAAREPRPTTPPIGIAARICERRTIAISFRIPKLPDYDITGIDGNRAIQIADCDERTGRFTTVPLDSSETSPGTGSATEYRLTFEYKAKDRMHTSNDRDVGCTITGRNVVDFEFTGSITCTSYEQTWNGTVDVSL
ncbi:MAG: hypothetical protein ABWX67_02315 [Allosphingosinicella sp.]